MTDRIRVRPFESEDVEAAAALFSKSYAEYRIEYPEIPDRYADVDQCKEILARFNDMPSADGAVAECGDGMSGFLFGLRLPNGFGLPVGPRDRIVNMVTPGSALAQAQDADDVVGLLYAFLSKKWVAEGYFEHMVGLPAADSRLEKAWFNHSFGRSTAREVRPTTLISVPDVGVNVRRASKADLDSVVTLYNELGHYHSRPPIFWLHLPDEEQRVIEYNSEFLDDSRNAVFLAMDGAAPSGMMMFAKRESLPEAMNRQMPEDTMLLTDAVVSEKARSAGIGSALLEAGFDWARNEGITDCQVTYALGNPLGRPFWQKNGFRVLWHSLSRRVDPRAVWAR